MQRESGDDRRGRCPVCRTPGDVGDVCPGASHPTRTARAIPTEWLGPAERKVDAFVGRLWADMLVVRKLGHGGTGAVYLALQGADRRPVALKLLLPDASTTQGFGTRRFRKEAEALARLRHPNIVRLLGFDVYEGRPYMVMEYVRDGRTLRQVLKAGEPGIDVSRHVLHQLVDALTAMHAVGVVHRDLKPSNVMIQPVPRDDWFLRVVDFGLAKMIDQGMVTEHMAGTLSYMAPEQLVTGRIGPWTDFYAAGLIAARLLTGRHPFPLTGDRPLLQRRLDRRIDPVDALGVEVHPTVAAFLRAALAWHPKHRLREPDAFRLALEGACAALDAELSGAPTMVVDADGPVLPPTIIGTVAPPDALPTRADASMLHVPQKGGVEPSSPPIVAPRPLDRRAAMIVIGSAVVAGGVLGVVLGAGRRSDEAEDDVPGAPTPRPAKARPSPLDAPPLELDPSDAGPPDAEPPDADPPDAVVLEPIETGAPDAARPRRRRRRRPARTRARRGAQPAPASAEGDDGELMERF